jgi:hypothetical protein
VTDLSLTSACDPPLTAPHNILLLLSGVLGFLANWYYAPSGFNFGGDDNTQPVIMDPGLEDNNVQDVSARGKREGGGSRGKLLARCLSLKIAYNHQRYLLTPAHGST